MVFEFVIDNFLRKFFLFYFFSNFKKAIYIFPVRFGKQIHVKLFTPVCSHKPPFKHGWVSQMFVASSQTDPLNPDGQML